MPQYTQAQTGAVAFDLSTFGKLSLTGKDRAAFLQNFTTNDVVKPGVGSGCEAFLTTAQARMVAWLRIAIRESDLYLNMEPGLVTKVIIGSDRSAANGDIANKIGSYQIAVLAREFDIPLIVLTQRSAKAFRFGLRGGKGRV